MTCRTRVIAADEAGVLEAARLIRAGEIVAVPTETVYGLAADATDGQAVARIYAAKGRPRFNPLIVHVPGLAQAERLVAFDDRARSLAESFWPGPLTLVLPRREGAEVASLVTAGLPTLAVRVPAHPVMQALLAAVDGPLAAPSANRSGGISPTRAAHAADSLCGRVPIVLDGGAAPVGLESTILSVLPGEPPRLLRPGAIAAEALEAVLREPLAVAGAGISAPGQLASHYAPDKPLRLGATEAGPGEWLIGFGSVPGHASLSLVGDLREAASRLFDMLHQADRNAASAIAIAPIPAKGLGIAINDRLARAAAPR